VLRRERAHCTKKSRIERRRKRIARLKNREEKESLDCMGKGAISVGCHWRDRKGREENVAGKVNLGLTALARASGAALV